MPDELKNAVWQFKAWMTDDRMHTGWANAGWFNYGWVENCILHELVCDIVWSDAEGFKDSSFEDTKFRRNIKFMEDLRIQS